MKKLTLIIAILAIVSAGFANAVEWHTANEKTISWDAVTTLTDGNPIPANHTLKYRIYLANAITDPDKTNAALLVETDQLSYSIVLNTEGKYFAGVQTVRYDENNVEVSISGINWSDINGEYTPNPFGIQHFIPTEMPKNLR